jgi:DNA-binding transcriptional LysR family regulator
MSLDLLRLRSFVDAVRLGSFAAAAQAHGYTAPAVSQHVAALERDLGCTLLVRGRRGVRPTAAGEVLRGRAEELLSQAQLTELAVREASGQIRSLRVGAFPTGARHLLPPALIAVRSAHPDAELTLVNFEPPDGLAQLAAGEVDVVLTHRYPGVDTAAPTGVRLRGVRKDPLVLLVPSEHALGRRVRIDIGDLRDEVFISGTAHDANRIALETSCAKAGFAPRVAFETGDYAVTETLVAHGFGLALVPLLACEHGLPGTTRINIRVNGETPGRRIAIAHRIAERSTLVRALVDHLLQPSS